MSATSDGRLRAGRTLLGLGCVIALSASAPGCFFPEFTFADTEGGGGNTPTTSGVGGTTSSTGMTTSTSPTTHSEGGGGTMTTSTMEGGGGTTSSTTEGGGGTGGTMEGGGGTGGTTTTSTTTTTTTPAVEDCQNGIDDDGDSLADCKDLDDCADYSCVPSVPATWTGYFLLYDGALAQDPGCVEGFPMENYVGSNNLNAPPPACGACSCGAPQGETCVPATNIVVSDAQCGNAPTYTGPMNMPGGWSGQCAHPLNGLGNPMVWSADVNCGPDMAQQCNQSISGGLPVVNGGFCESTGGGMDIVPATWQGFGRACGGAVTTGKGCNLNQVCMPKPPDPFVGGVCIKKAGDQNCPSGVSPFNQKHIFYENFTDSRTCTTCSCGQSEGATCAGTISVHSDLSVNTCNQFVASYPAGGCVNFPGNPIVGPLTFTATTPPTGGSCQAFGGTPQGAATPTFPTTFCCMQP